MARELSVAIAIATAGRPTILTETLRDLVRQTRRPDYVAICPAEPSDVERDALEALGLPIGFSRAGRGATRQRNALLRDMPAVDVVLFLDDDFLPAPDYVAEVKHLFTENPDVVLATGALIADGIHGPGFEIAAARALVENAPQAEESLRDVFCGYGCNMAVRRRTVAENGIWFDENLPLYSWAEDVEFSRQLASYGRIVRASRLRGVHLGTKRGRTTDIRLGYSQVANQVYLRRKGMISTSDALLRGGRNVLANLRGLVRSESYLDRRSRLVGNIYGLIDVVRGRSSPERILDL